MLDRRVDARVAGAGRGEGQKDGGGRAMVVIGVAQAWLRVESLADMEGEIVWLKTTARC